MYQGFCGIFSRQLRYEEPSRDERDNNERRDKKLVPRDGEHRFCRYIFVVGSKIELLEMVKSSLRVHEQLNSYSPAHCIVLPLRVDLPLISTSAPPGYRPAQALPLR